MKHHDLVRQAFGQATSPAPPKEALPPDDCNPMADRLIVAICFWPATGATLQTLADLLEAQEAVDNGTISQTQEEMDLRENLERE